jgi:hypothetical protein
MRPRTYAQHDGRFKAVVEDWVDLNQGMDPPDPYMGFKIIAELGMWKNEANAMEAARLWIKDLQGS